MKFKDDIVWSSLQKVTQQMLQNMVANDLAINELSLEGILLNINPDSKNIRKNRWITNNLAIISNIIDVTPKGDLKYDEDGNAYFDKEYQFPNNLWNNNYQPSVVITPAGNSSLPQSVVIYRLTPNKVNFRIYVLKDMRIDASRKFAVQLIGIGVRPDTGVTETDSDII